MPSSRLDTLRAFADKRPDDPFVQYALAMELKSSGDPAGAWQTLEVLVQRHPDYLASYAPAAEILVDLHRKEEARALLAKGIAACGRRGDAHTREHLEDALADLQE